MVFSDKIVDLFGKIVDLSFERGVLPHLENPPWLQAWPIAITLPVLATIKFYNGEIK